MLLLGEGSEATEPYNKYDKIRPHSIRSLQFDQKVRPLSFRPEKFDLFTATHFLSEVEVKFKFADDSSAIISAFNTDTLHSALQAICHNIEFWCKKWRMVVNGSKTELLLLNCLVDNTEPILLNGERCKTKQTTKSLGLTIDTNLTYRKHASITASKALTSWRLLKSKYSNRWGLSIPTQAYLYKTIIRPQLLYAEPIWAQRNYVTASSGTAISTDFATLTCSENLSKFLIRCVTWHGACDCSFRCFYEIGRYFNNKEQERAKRRARRHDRSQRRQERLKIDSF